MKRQLTVTLTKAEVGEIVLKAVVRQLKLPDGNHQCSSCSTSGDGLMLTFDIEERGPSG